MLGKWVCTHRFFYLCDVLIMSGVYEYYVKYITVCIFKLYIYIFLKIIMIMGDESIWDL